jgi:hypothetical protein
VEYVAVSKESGLPSRTVTSRQHPPKKTDTKPEKSNNLRAVVCGLKELEHAVHTRVVEAIGDLVDASRWVAIPD